MDKRRRMERLLRCGQAYSVHHEIEPYAVVAKLKEHAAYLARLEVPHAELVGIRSPRHKYGQVGVRADDLNARAGPHQLRALPASRTVFKRALSHP